MAGCIGRGHIRCNPEHARIGPRLGRHEDFRVSGKLADDLHRYRQHTRSIAVAGSRVDLHIQRGTWLSQAGGCAVIRSGIKGNADWPNRQGHLNSIARRSQIAALSGNCPGRDRRIRQGTRRIGVHCHRHAPRQRHSGRHLRHPPGNRIRHSSSGQYAHIRV